MELRPLGFGEIFDRAITLYVRNFMPFLAIVLVLIVPLAVVQYFLDKNQSAQIDQLIKIFQHPGATPPPTPNLFSSPGELVAVIAVALVFYTLWPFALDAVAVGVARLYRGRPVEFKACYGAVLPRWLSIVGTLLLQIAIAIAWYVAFLLVVFLSILVAAVFARAWLPLGIVGFAAAFVMSAAMMLVVLPIFIALSFSMYAVVIEKLGPGAAIASGFVRVFNRKEFWRAMLFSLAAIAIVFGGSMVIAAVAWTALIFHAIAVEVVLGSLLRAAFAPFSIVLIAVYYYDVRIRREAFDLETELERLTSDPLVA